MNRQPFILFFIACNVVIVFAHIQNHTNAVRQLYLKQRNEKMKEELLKKKATAIRMLYTLKNPATVKEFAVTQLNMQKIALHQIKMVNLNEK